MSKYHVGDRWADQNGDEWLVYSVKETHIFAGQTSRGTTCVFFTDPGCIDRLTRLISSERWIPFAEMMPDDAHQETRTIIVRDPTRKADADRERLVVPVSDDQFDLGCWLESHQDDGIEDMIAHGYSEWKYLTPPEAPK